MLKFVIFSVFGHRQQDMTVARRSKVNLVVELALVGAMSASA